MSRWPSAVERSWLRELDTDARGAELHRLPADADEEARRRLIEKLVPILAQNLVDYPWLSDPSSRLSKSADVTRQTFIDAVSELHNPAQLDVLARVSILANELAHAMRDESGQAG